MGAGGFWAHQLIMVGADNMLENILISCPKCEGV